MESRAKVEIYEGQSTREVAVPGGPVEVRSDEPEWRWRVKAANGEIVASGEGYTRREDAVRGFADAAHAMRQAQVDLSGSV